MVPADAYVSFMLFIAGVVGFLVALNAFLLGFVVSHDLGFSAIVALPTFFVAGLFAFAFTYLYPSVASGKKKRAIEEGLPYTVSFMSILSSSGIPPKRVMRSLAELERDDVGLGGESTVMYRDMELMGEDLLSVLKEESRKDISPLLTGVLDGFVTTIRAGGDLGLYFKEEAKGLMRLRQSIMKAFVDVLAMVAEMYMGLMVAFPLILIVMLVVMSSIGGGTIGGTGPETIVPIVIYGLVPGAGAVVLLLLDSLSAGT
ncbi:MAG: type II secretion system F family protein [Nitrososphaerales archaeon]|nr:type II secretion system F family protein [Nitrososphaerales archaeon]